MFNIVAGVGSLDGGVKQLGFLLLLFIYRRYTWGRRSAIKLFGCLKRGGRPVIHDRTRGARPSITCLQAINSCPELIAATILCNRNPFEGRTCSKSRK